MNSEQWQISFLISCLHEVDMFFLQSTRISRDEGIEFLDDDFI